MTRRGQPGASAARLAAVALAVISAVLLARGLARFSSGAGHVVMVGPYSPFKVGYLVGLVAVIVTLLGWLPGATLRLGIATAITGAAVALAAAACLVGYLEAVALQDWTLMRLPPTEETENALTTAISFVRVTIVFFGLLFGGVALLAVSWPGRSGNAVALVGHALRTAAVSTRSAVMGAGALFRRRPGIALSLLALVALLVNVTGLRYQDGDRATFSVIGRIILDGGVPYRDAWDIKFPAIYYVSAAFQWLDRRAGAVGLPPGVASGAAETLIIALTVWAFYRLSREFFGPSCATALALVFAVVANDPILTAGGHLTETYALLPVILASLHAVRFLRGRAWCGNALAVGFWSAVAAMVRPQALMPLVAFLGAVWLGVLRRGGGRQLVDAAGATGLTAVAFVVPWVALLGYLMRLRALGDFLDLPLGFNSFIAREFPPSFRLAGTVAFANYLGVLLPLVAGAAVVLGRLALRRRNGAGFRIAPRWAFVLFLAAGDFVGVIAIGRVSFHYMLQAAPALCLLLGVGLSRIRPGRPPVARRTVAIAATMLLFQAAAGYALYLARPSATVPDYPLVVSVAQFIKANTQPGDSIFSGTSRSEAIYYYADRRPASRYLYVENAIAAYTRGRYLREIEIRLAEKPPRLLITDPNDRWYDAQNGMESPLSRYVEANYAFVTRIEAKGVAWLIFRPRGGTQ